MKITEISKKYPEYYWYFSSRPKEGRGKFNYFSWPLEINILAHEGNQVQNSKKDFTIIRFILWKVWKHRYFCVFHANIKILLQWKSFSRKLKLILSSLITPSFKVKCLKLALVPPLNNKICKRDRRKGLHILLFDGDPSP